MPIVVVLVFASYDFSVYEDKEDHNDPAVRAKRLGLLSLGRSVLSGETNMKQLVDDSFNKWAAPADELPEWFLDDDQEHWKPHGPAQETKVTAEDRARVAAFADRPIKKVAEVRARKKKKMRDKMARVSTKASSIATNSELPQQQRMKMIKKLYSGVAPGERGKTYMVGNRKSTMEKKRVVKGKTRGSVRMVDARLKSDRKGNAEYKNSKRKKKGPKRKTG